MDSPQSPPIPANARHGNTSLPLWPPDETWAPGLELPNPGHHALHLRSAREEIMPPMSATVRCKRIPPPCWKSRISNTPHPRIEQKNTLNVRFAVAESIFLRTMMMAFQGQWATGSTFLNHRNPQSGRLRNLPQANACPRLMWLSRYQPNRGALPGRRQCCTFSASQSRLLGINATVLLNLKIYLGSI